VKALSIRQPWAWAIFRAGKDIENRQWNTHLRETIAIHASGNLDKDAILPEGTDKPHIENLRRRAIIIEELRRHAIIGIVDLVDVVEESSSEWFTGPDGFVLENARALPLPITCKGALKFWEVPPEIVRDMERQLGEKLEDPSA
jgi:hypothetical protein